jgi:ribosomal protein S15P/S13E
MRAEYTQEIRQMGLTIAEMRAQLEKAAVDKERAVSQAKNAFGAQIADLQRTIQTLRQHMEEQVARKDAAVDRATQELASENRQLREAVQVMREQLEVLDQRLRSKVSLGEQT